MMFQNAFKFLSLTMTYLVQTYISLCFLSTGDPQVHLNPSSTVVTIVDNESKD